MHVFTTKFIVYYFNVSCPYNPWIGDYFMHLVDFGEFKNRDYFSTGFGNHDGMRPSENQEFDY